MTTLSYQNDHELIASDEDSLDFSKNPMSSLDLSKSNDVQMIGLSPNGVEDFCVMQFTITVNVMCFAPLYC